MARGIIRKVVVGSEYRKDSMHYLVGNEVANILKIEKIVQTGPQTFEIWVIKDGERLLWKKLVNLPVHVEYNLDFEVDHEGSI